MRAQPASAVQAVPNVTPMIDVMLVLLVVFMVAAPAMLEGCRAEPPAAVYAVDRPTEDEDQVLGIDDTGALYLNKRPIARQQLATALQAIYSARSVDKVLYLRADEGAPYELVLDVLDMASNNGVAVVGMISQQRAVSDGRLDERSLRR